MQSKLYISSYFEEKENSEVNAADHQDRDQELEESRESSVPSMRHIRSLIHKRNLMLRGHAARRASSHKFAKK